MENILIHQEGRTGIITLNRADKRNALNSEMIGELRSAFRNHILDENVKVIILKSNGPIFCAGADLAYLQKLQSFSHEENLTDSNHLRELFEEIYTSPKVVIAQVQGHALAGGCGLASVCDLIVAVPEAKFGYTEVRIGFIPAIVMIFLLRKVGEGHARRLLIAGELITAAAAQQIGLVTRVVEPTQLEQEVHNLADHLIKFNSGEAMMITKKMIVEIQGMSLKDALDYAVEMNARARSTTDCKKGIAAFLNKDELSW